MESWGVAITAAAMLGKVSAVAVAVAVAVASARAVSASSGVTVVEGARTSGCWRGARAATYENKFSLLGAERKHERSVAHLVAAAVVVGDRNATC